MDAIGEAVHQKYAEAARQARSGAKAGCGCGTSCGPDPITSTKPVGSTMTCCGPTCCA
jgi:hypothetical protein